jgi:hypothetical protein
VAFESTRTFGARCAPYREQNYDQTRHKTCMKRRNKCAPKSRQTPIHTTQFNPGFVDYTICST